MSKKCSFTTKDRGPEVVGRHWSHKSQSHKFMCIRILLFVSLEFLLCSWIALQNTWCYADVGVLLQVSCAVRSYWQQSPSVVSEFRHSETSYFVGIRVQSVSVLTVISVTIKDDDR